MRRDQGFVNTTTIARIRPIISPAYPDCSNLVFTDQLRAEIFIHDLEQASRQSGDSLPDLMVLSLPDDHTSGTFPNFPVPQAMVADNDLAVGRIVDAITHSRFWDSTAIFITEDDSQSGWDHISPYRTTGLVISPYSVMGHAIHTNYNQTGMVTDHRADTGLTADECHGCDGIAIVRMFFRAKIELCLHACREYRSAGQNEQTHGRIEGQGCLLCEGIRERGVQGRGWGG